MALTPLPMAALKTSDSPTKGVFPYGEVKRNGQPNMPTEPRKMRPLLERKPISQQQDMDKTQPNISPEDMRMRELENMLNEAQSRTAVVEQEAYDKAYAAGEKAGLVLGEKRAEQMLDSLQQLVQQAEQHVEQVQQGAAASVVDIAVAVAEFVMGSLDDTTQKTLTLAVERAAEQMSVALEDVQKLTLAVHSHDLTALSRFCEQHPTWKIVVAKDVAQGTCILTSQHQDALVDPQQVLQQAVQHIRASLLSHHG